MLAIRFVKNSNMTKLEISRTLSRLESERMLSRVRDGIGKGVNLKNELI